MVYNNFPQQLLWLKLLTFGHFWSLIYAKAAYGPFSLHIHSLSLAFLGSHGHLWTQETCAPYYCWLLQLFAVISIRYTNIFWHWVKLNIFKFILIWLCSINLNNITSGELNLRSVIIFRHLKCLICFLGCTPPSDSDWMIEVVFIINLDLCQLFVHMKLDFFSEYHSLLFNYSVLWPRNYFLFLLLANILLSCILPLIILIMLLESSADISEAACSF